VLSGDHIYQMDYRDMSASTAEHGAALTIGARAQS
jgi:ADP-glucose pyrophosphorylase